MKAPNIDRDPLRNRTVLVVEDEPLLAFDYADELETRGARTQIALTLTEAISAVSANLPEFAILDVNLGAEFSWPVAVTLTRYNVPYVLVSGFQMRSRLPEGVEPLDCLEKPIGAHLIANRLIELAAASG